MSGLYNEFQVRLYRDGADTAWGFRLQGGSDFKTPLTVQRVFACSPAEGELQRGDVILEIDSRNVENFLHKQAQDLIKKGGTSLLLTIRRGGPSRSPQQQKPAQQAGVFPNIADRRRSFGDTGGYGLHSMHSRVDSSPFTVLAPGVYVKKEPTRKNEMLSYVKDTLEYKVHGPTQFWEPPAATYQPAPAPAPAPKPALIQNDMASRGSGRIPAVSTQVTRPPQFGVDYSSTGQEEAPKTFGTDYNARRAKPRQVEPAPSFGTDYRPVRSTANSDRQTPPREPDYHYAPVGEIKKKFGGPQPENVTVKRTGKRWQPPDPSATGGERALIYGWSSKVKPEQDYEAGPPHDRYSHGGVQQPTSGPPTAPKPSPPVHQPPQPQPVHYQQQPQQQQQQQQQQQRHQPQYQPQPAQQAYQPAYQQQLSPQQRAPQQQPAGAKQAQKKSAVLAAFEDEQAGSLTGGLRTNANMKPWEIEAMRAEKAQEEIERLTQERKQGNIGGRTMDITYGSGQPSGPQVVHLQYNTPMGMYSRGNVDTALSDQTAGRPGEGTLHISGGHGPQNDITQSKTYKLLHEQERGGPKAARYIDFEGQEIEYSGYQDQNRQSGAFQRLAEQTGTLNQEMAIGSSDF